MNETISTISGGITNATEIQYFWGTDLSWSLQGAGGVGCLLYLKRNGAIYVPHADSNGNIVRYTDTAGNVVAEYTYDAFGRIISQSGPMADIFRIRFSTKYFDSDTGLYYYGYRFYSTSLMRWLNRDPIEEDGGLNLYGFCGNGAVYSYDLLGEQRTNLPGIILDSLCEDAYRFARSRLQTAQERRAWDRYTKHGYMYSSRDIELSPKEVKSIAESINAVVIYIKNERHACSNGASFFKSKSIGGSAPPPWIKAIGGVSINVSTRCKNGCFSYEYSINDLYDFDIKGVPGFTSRDWKGELGTIGVNLSGTCLQCDWQTFYHRGTFYGK